MSCKHEDSEGATTLVVVPDPKDGKRELVRCTLCKAESARVSVQETTRQQTATLVQDLRAELARALERIKELETRADDTGKAVSSTIAAQADLVKRVEVLEQLAAEGQGR